MAEKITIKNQGKVWVKNGWRVVFNIRKTRSDCKKGRYTCQVFTGSRYKRIYLSSAPDYINH